MSEQPADLPLAAPKIRGVGQRVSAKRFAEAVRPVGVLARFAEVTQQQTKEIALAVVRSLPVLRDLVDLDHPRTQPLRSGSIRLHRWLKAPYGTPSKPQSLEEIPWDYVEENQDKIPFLGLREYWYPAIETRQLRNNEPTPVTMLGENLIFFRDADGRAKALENRCPHRGTLLSLGQVGVFEPGTITCRYHGMTFDGEGECVAFLADGPDSSACGKFRVRSYPVEEHAGIIWVYMGDRQPEPFLDWHPHARSVLEQENLLIHQVEVPFSHLNIMDNATDLTHVGCLHRTCLLFSGQKPFGDVGYEELDGGRGLRAFYTDAIEQPGEMHIDHIEWYLPNHVYHGPGDLGGGLGEGWFWFVPRDVGSFTGWFVMGKDSSGGRIRKSVMSTIAELLFGRVFGRTYFWPGNAMSCLEGGDIPMMASQGRVPRWDKERAVPGDRSVLRARRIIQKAHIAEVEERMKRAAENGERPKRIQRPTNHVVAEP